MGIVILIRCRICKDPKQEPDFYSRPGGKRHTACKTCLSKRNVEHVKNNKDGRNAYMRQYLRELKAGTRTREGYALIAAAKKQPCKDCGGSFPEECMDFDHREGEEKKFSIGNMTLSAPATVAAELTKCDVVCSNCHRIRTRKRLFANIAAYGHAYAVSTNG